MAKRWTKKEIEILKSGYEKGMTAAEVAAELGRSVNGVYAKARQKLSLPAYAGKRHHMWIEPGKPYPKRGRILVKNEKGKIEAYSRYLWRTTVGPVPKGFVVALKNGDPMDVRLENLYLASKSEILAQNFKKGYKKAGEMVIHRRRMSTTGEKWMDLVLKAAV